MVKILTPYSIIIPVFKMSSYTETGPISGDRANLSEFDYCVQTTLKTFNGRISEYWGAKKTILGFSASIALRLGEMAVRSKRRFPEFSPPHTEMYMSVIWSLISKDNIIKHPQAIDAASSFITLVYGLDNVMDMDPALEKVRKDYSVSDKEFLNSCMKSLTIAGVGGHEILGDFVTTMALDYPHRDLGRNELLNECVKYLLDWVALHRGKNLPERWTFENALKMRQVVSGVFGGLLIKLMAYSNPVRKISSAESTAGEIIGMAGQFQDDIWDLVEEVPEEANGNCHNMFLLISRQYCSEEYFELFEVLNRLKSQGIKVIDAKQLEKLTPQSYELYLKKAKEHLLNMAGINLVLIKLANSQIEEFKSIFRLVKQMPEKQVGSKIKPDRIRRNQHIRTRMI